MFLKIFILIKLFFIISSAAVDRVKDNGDIYMVNGIKYFREHRGLKSEKVLTTTEEPAYIIDFVDIVAQCNSSFSIPMDHYIQFNTTSELPNIVDKTGMCFVRCFYEKSGILDNWKLNRSVIMANIWPATGDTLEVCEMEGVDERNPCVRAYAIAKCLTIRALVDAPSKE